MSCLFCQIIAGEIPAKIVYQDDTVLAFEDIAPKAPTHILVIPRKHLATVNDLTDTDTAVAGRLVQTAKILAKKLGIAEDGYRLVINCNDQGGQEIHHIHLHLLGGRQMTWPPG